MTVSEHILVRTVLMSVLLLSGGTFLVPCVCVKDPLNIINIIHIIYIYILYYCDRQVWVHVHKYFR